MFLQDDGCSTGTSSDDGTNVDGLSNQDGAETYQDYAFAEVPDATAGVGITARASRWWRKEWWIQSKEPTRQAWSGDEMQ